MGTTSNGVTAYPVTVRIDDTDGLLPGMNVDAEIVVESVTGVLAVPVEAVVRGNMVLVKDGGANAGESAAPSEKAFGPAGAASVPEGFTYVRVTLGVNNDDYIEIKSGLSEGDTIAVVQVNTDTGGMTGNAGFVVAGGAGERDYNGGGSYSGGPPAGGGPMVGGGPMGG